MIRQHSTKDSSRQPLTPADHPVYHNKAMPSHLPTRFIAYPKAYKLLSNRLGSIPEEISAWIWAGPENNGLAAYAHVKDRIALQRFYYEIGGGNDFNYLSPLMDCWFLKKEIADFQPIDRFITGEQLLTRWSELPGIETEAFIRVKISELELQDIHPIYGGTQGTSPGDSSYPPLEAALFMLSEVDKIEAEDFPGQLDNRLNQNAVHKPSPEIGSAEWRSQTARKAANTRHDKPGGSRDKQKQIQEIWASGKYTTRDICAEQECAGLNISFSAARKALRNIPKP